MARVKHLAPRRDGRKSLALRKDGRKSGKSPAEGSAAEGSAAERSAAERSAAEGSAAEGSAAEGSAAEESASERSAAERSTASQTKLKKSSSKRSATPVGGEEKKKKRRSRSGTVAIREIRKFQKSCELLIPKAPFRRNVKQISGTVNEDPIRWGCEAHKAIQMAAEAFGVDLFEEGVRLLAHAKRVTLKKRDLDLARYFLQRGNRRRE